MSDICDTVFKDEEVIKRRLERRRRILENSKSRLEKLNGKISTTVPNESIQHREPIVYPDPEVEQELFDNLVNPRYETSSTNPKKIDDLFRTFGNQKDDHSFPVKLIKAKIHIALLSALTYFVLATQKEQYRAYNAFLPLLLWEIVEVIYLGTTELTSGTYVRILLLAAFPTYDLKPIIKVINILNKIFEDVSVFIFFFTLYHLFGVPF